MIRKIGAFLLAVLLFAAPAAGAQEYREMMANTTREEREQIVAESIGNISGLCDGCSPGIIEMYQDYIDGKRELREINADFRTRYLSGTHGPERNGCGME